MIRRQIQLDPTADREVRRLAAELGVSITEVVRRALDEHLARERAAGPSAVRWARAREAFGRFADREGRGDVAARHDKALAEGLADWSS